MSSAVFRKHASAVPSGIALIAAHPATHAEAYPDRPIRLVVPFPPADANDILARTLSPRLTESWGQQVVIDHRPGAGGNIGADIVAKARPDGYTLLLGYVGDLTQWAGIVRTAGIRPE